MASLLFLILLLLMALVTVTPPPALGTIASVVVALVVADFIYRARIGIRKWGEGKKH